MNENIPIRMQDSRALTNYTPPRTIVSNMKKSLGITNNEDYRKFLQANGEKLIKAENAFWSNR